jgi:superfamily II DNA or RNA helicase
MKINLNIDENERQRILEMHENATKKHRLIEQGVTDTTGVTATTYSEESKPARLFIHQQFGIGGDYNSSYKTMTREERQKYIEDAKSKLSSMDMNEMVNAASAAGLSEESVMALQNELVKISGKPGLTFISKNITKDFVDGKLGTNTIAAYLDHMIYLQSLPEYKGPPSTVTTQFGTGAGKGSIQGTYKVGKQ